MIIPHPHTFKRSDNPYRTKLFFEGQSAEFYLRGAISWPEGRKEGFALLAGMHLQSKKIWLFDEWVFWTIDHWVLEDGTIKQRDDGFWYGLTHFMTQNAAKFGCTSYFWGGQHEDVARRNIKAVYRSKMAPPDVHLIEAPYVHQVGDDLIEEYLRLERLSGDANSVLFEHLSTAGVDDRGGVQALRCLLSGYEHQPFIE
jgi:hypothetical protein